MARASKSANETPKPIPASAGSSFIHWFFQPAMLFRMSLVAGVCALWPYAIQRMPSLENRPEYRIAFSQIQVSPAPEHPVPTDLLDQVAAQSKMPRELSLLSESLTVDVAQAFRRHPWVAKVIRVRKSFPATITVELEYRKPVVMAQVQGGLIPVDLHGVILPTTDFSAANANQYPFIQNAGSKPKTAPGQVWKNPSILAAARLADVIGQQWKSLKLEAIVLPRNTDPATDPNDVILELVGKGGSKIVWGRPPGSDHPGELEASQKVRRLEKYLLDYGDYAQPHGPYEIDIRHWQEISRRPLVAEQTPVKPVKSPKPQSRVKVDSAALPLREAKNLRPEPRK